MPKIDGFNETEGGINMQHEVITTSYYSIEPKILQCSEILKNSLESELDIKIGLKQDGNIEKYKQLIYEYYLKAEDLETKCTLLHRNLQEVKDAWEKAKIMKDSALKERENMTLKFAKGERKMLNEKELKEKAEKKIKTLEREMGTLQQKLQTKIDEKTRISVLYDNKVHEFKEMKNENGRIMNENCMLKNELKLCQIALKNQVDLHAKSQITIKVLEEKIKNVIGEKQAEVDLERVDEYIRELHVRLEDKEQQLENLEKTCEDLISKHQNLLIEKDTFSNRIQSLESKISKYEHLLQHEAFSSDNIEDGNNSQIYAEENTLDELNKKLDLLEIKNKELESDIQSCRIRESDTLLFNQQLSEKNVKLQSDNHNFQTILQGVTTEKNELKKLHHELCKNFETLSKQLASEKEKNLHEKMKLLVELDTLRKNSVILNRQNLKLKHQMFDQQGELTIMRKKHNCSLREFRKELSFKYNQDVRSSSSCPSSLSLRSISVGTEQSYDQVEVIQPETVLNQNVLIERILRLQRTVVRKSEKIDFLEDRIESLLSELHKKRRLLQFYFLQEQSESLTSNKMDQVKLNLSKYGGVMASLYDAKVSDHNLTLGLSLEINCKLQAVLEDSLLRNIILKENIETLGEEIEKLNRQLKKR